MQINENKFLYFFFNFFHSNILAESILIQAKKISLDKDKATSIFEDEVVVKTEYGVIKSDFVEYNKKGFLVFKENVAEDIKKVVETEYAEYFEINKIFKTEGLTRIITSEVIL